MREAVGVKLIAGDCPWEGEGDNKKSTFQVYFLKQLPHGRHCLKESNQGVVIDVPEKQYC